MKKSVESGIEGEILSSKKPVLQEINETATILAPDLQWASWSQINFIYSVTVTKLIEFCQQFRQVFAHPVCPNKCHAEGTGLQVEIAGETATATVLTVDKEGRKCCNPVDISCEMVSDDGRYKATAKVQKTNNNKYQISYRIQTEDNTTFMNIPKSPFPLLVISTTPTHTITGLKNSWRVAVNGRGQVIVSEYGGHCISIFSSSGQKKYDHLALGDFLPVSWSIQNSYVALTDTGDINF